MICTSPLLCLLLRLILTKLRIHSNILSIQVFCGVFANYVTIVQNSEVLHTYILSFCNNKMCTFRLILNKHHNLLMCSKRNVCRIIMKFTASLFNFHLTFTFLFKKGFRIHTYIPVEDGVKLVRSILIKYWRPPLIYGRYIFKKENADIILVISSLLKWFRYSFPFTQYQYKAFLCRQWIIVDTSNLFYQYLLVQKNEKT